MDLDPYGSKPFGSEEHDARRSSHTHTYLRPLAPTRPGTSFDAPTSDDLMVVGERSVVPEAFPERRGKRPRGYDPVRGHQHHLEDSQPETGVSRSIEPKRAKMSRAQAPARSVEGHYGEHHEAEAGYVPVRERERERERQHEHENASTISLAEPLTYHHHRPPQSQPQYEHQNQSQNQLQQQNQPQPHSTSALQPSTSSVTYLPDLATGQDVGTSTGIGMSSSISSAPIVEPPQCIIVHRVLCHNNQTAGEDHSKHLTTAYFLDAPRLFARDSRGHALRGRDRVTDVDEYLETHPMVSMVVYRDYDCGEYHRMVRDEFQRVAPDNMDQSLFLSFKAWFYCLGHDTEPAVAQKESLDFVSVELQEALDAVVRNSRDTANAVSHWNEPRNLAAPYDYFYHHSATFENESRGLEWRHQLQIGMLLDYIRSEFGSFYDEANASFERGWVARKHFPLLFRSNEIVVAHQERDKSELAYMIERYEGEEQEGIVLHCWSWQFDGAFKKTPIKLTVPWPETFEPCVSITALKVWPLRLDRSGLFGKLKRRGREFWSCRKRKLVSYAAPRATNFELQTTNPKYMIDTETYKYLHPKQDKLSVTDHPTEVIGVDTVEPPDDTFLLLLPATILGYGFHDKRWRTLEVAHLTEIPWNETALDRVVLKDIKKELIKALVKTQLEKSKAADVVENKGNGMILLLHGPPGTGKTLTAEGVAEYARKPLYRVTCGDIGTEPESVEKYLEGALYLGTIWGCVVLLDEADVFLEERSQTDLVRNALVSVFLRVLEYYEGILILTSNRVGTFDEAFKSRMQLAVQYPHLDEKGRSEIWFNFFKALKEAGFEFNFKQVIERVPLLREHDLNGRQIRNTIKTARQLAAYRQQLFSYEHISSVIDVTNEFEDYLRKTKGHTDDEFAAAEGIR
ncbi:hypothetical protein A1O3_04055 [Capronia epimyces CBS 606.96]|uniref:AAA+ ATPase domain-containing protein n=1 Tax=Capronia epimyces CBS 606.96 TaxID=1182542 RepID=W9Y2R3_9EURO|nr:uncharacterized protein A1O3_04055 [Capronia epimyces CBS 606.96]EXJ87097.1 hypothetical protein A1O3_04055 [Capronia epimyces CBS 606.96]